VPVLGSALDVVTGEVGHARFQARNAGVGEVISVLGQPGALAGAEELADLAVGDQVGGGAVALVEEGERTVARNLLVAGAVEPVSLKEQEAFCAAFWEVDPSYASSSFQARLRAFCSIRFCRRYR